MTSLGKVNVHTTFYAIDVRSAGSVINVTVGTLFSFYLV